MVAGDDVAMAPSAVWKRLVKSATEVIPDSLDVQTSFPPISTVAASTWRPAMVVS